MPAFTIPPLPTIPSSDPSPRLTNRFLRPLIAHQSLPPSTNPRPTLTTTASASTPTSIPPTPFSQLFSASDSDTVLTLSNAPISLTDYVNRQNAQNVPVLIGWLRHYGCTLCKKQAADWAKLAPRLKRCGNVSVALIGNGTVAQAQDFKQEMGWEGDLFTDPSRGTYKALQFLSGVGITFTLPGLFKVIQSLKEGNSQTFTRLPTDAFQQGGAVLVDPNGVVSLFHRDAFAGDHMDVEVLYESTCAACQQSVGI